MILDQIQAAVRKYHPHIYARVVPQKVDDDREQIEPSECDGRRNNQFTSWYPELVGGFTFSVINVLKNTTASRNE